MPRAEQHRINILSHKFHNKLCEKWMEIAQNAREFLKLNQMIKITI